MLLKSIFAIVFAILFAAPLSAANVTLDHDEFTDTHTLETGNITLSGTPSPGGDVFLQLRLVAEREGDAGEWDIIFVFATTHSEPYLRRSSSLDFITPDGKINFDEALRNTHRTSAGRHWERGIYRISEEEFSKLSQSTETRGRINTTEFEFSETQIRFLQQIGELMDR